MDPILLRSFERILDAIMGGISIYLGYRLFLKLPEKTDSQGKIILPGNISIYLSRVGPGVFFALFGAAVIALSLHHTVQYSVEPSTTETAGVATQKKSYLGASPDTSPLSPADLEQRQSLLRPSLHWLNQLAQQVTGFKNDDGRVNMQLQVPAIKLELIEAVWGPDWCAFETFEQWVNHGAVPPYPEGCRQANDLFFYGKADLAGGQ